MKTAIRKYFGDFVWITALFVVSIGVTAFILAHQKTRGRIAFLQTPPFEFKIDLADAAAVTPGQGQTAVIAGVKVGKISKVELQQGHAVVTIGLKPRYRTLIHTDASALLRPRTGLKDMFIELDPGTNREPLLSQGSHIPLRNTAPTVDFDQVLSSLDANTRDYLQLLINGAGKGLNTHGDDLRLVLQRFEPLHRDLARINGAISERRRNLATLVHNYGQLTTQLGSKDKDLMTLVDASNAALSAFAQENQNISTAVGELPGALNQTRSTLVKVNRLGTVLGPTFESLRPAFRQLNTSNHEVLPFVREAEPIVRTKIRPFVRTARAPVRDLRPAAQGISRALPDLTTSFFELNRFFNLLSYNPHGRETISQSCETSGRCSSRELDRQEGYLYWLAYTAQTGDQTFATSDSSGPFRRITEFLDCSSIANTQNQNPAAGAIFGFTGLLSSTGPCSTKDSSGGGGGGASSKSAPAPKSKAAKAPAAKAAAAKPGSPKTPPPAAKGASTKAGAAKTSPNPRKAP